MCPPLEESQRVSNLAPCNPSLQKAIPQRLVNAVKFTYLLRILMRFVLFQSCNDHVICFSFEHYLEVDELSAILASLHLELIANVRETIITFLELVSHFERIRSFLQESKENGLSTFAMTFVISCSKGIHAPFCSLNVAYCLVVCPKSPGQMLLKSHANDHV